MPDGGGGEKSGWPGQTLKKFVYAQASWGIKVIVSAANSERTASPARLRKIVAMSHPP